MTAQRPARLLAIAACAAIVLLVAAVPSSAAEEVTATDSAWYTSLSLSAGGVPLGDPLALNTLESGDLPVGAAGQEEHKRSYVRFAVPEGATRLTIELPLSENSAASFGAPGPILACPLTDPFFVESAKPLDAAPAIDCSGGVPGQPNAELTEGATATAYTFDLTPLLAGWTDPETAGGIALVADLTDPQPAYQIAFKVNLFEPVGSADGGRGGGGADGFAPPPDRPGRGGGPAPVSPADGGTADEPFVGGSSGSLGVPTDDAPAQAPAPMVADALGAPAEQAPLAAPQTVAVSVPLAAVNMLPWYLSLPVAASALVAAGRSVRAGTTRRSALDRLLGS